MDALEDYAEEGRSRQRYLSGRSQHPFDPTVSESSNRPDFIGKSRVKAVPQGNDIAFDGAPGEVKHLSTRRKRN